MNSCEQSLIAGYALVSFGLILESTSAYQLSYASGILINKRSNFWSVPSGTFSAITATGDQASVLAFRSFQSQLMISDRHNPSHNPGHKYQTQVNSTKNLISTATSPLSGVLLKNTTPSPIPSHIQYSGI